MAAILQSTTWVTRIASVSTHDRRVEVPEFADAPEVLTQTAPHACLSTQLAADATAVPPWPAP